MMREHTLSCSPVELVPLLDTREFFERFFQQRQPVVIEGVTRGWAPSEFWAWPALCERYRDATVVAARLRHGTLYEKQQRGVVFERIRLGQFARAASHGEAAAHYVMAPVWNFPPDLQRHFEVPRYCARAKYLRSKLWIARAGTVTPLHWDIPHNFHVHLSGRKRWLLFPPQATRCLYPRGIWSGMPNFAQVDPEQPDWNRFPRFRFAHGYQAVLEPGQTLFIPSGWWHYTRTLEDAVSLNFWWGGYGVALAAFASTCFKRLRGIRQNEWA
ncbi:MAG: hypothetical protein KatS3mg077_2345 [Candidatus Binatia bacterium]|nr:MAG: hypothetical protein KatS3mg077_2345 [Candidatus Binatia bacterium]